MLEKLRAWAQALKRQIVIVWHLARDPKTPWWLKAWFGITLAYALSPIDLIPDFIPVFGLLDDLILLPFFIWLGMHFSAPQVLANARAAADAALRLPASRAGAIGIAAIWALAIGATAVYFWRKT